MCFIDRKCIFQFLPLQASLFLLVSQLMLYVLHLLDEHAHTLHEDTLGAHPVISIELINTLVFILQAVRI